MVKKDILRFAYVLILNICTNNMSAGGFTFFISRFYNEQDMKKIIACVIEEKRQQEERDLRMPHPIGKKSLNTFIGDHTKKITINELGFRSDDPRTFCNEILRNGSGCDSLVWLAARQKINTIFNAGYKTCYPDSHRKVKRCVSNVLRGVEQKLNMHKDYSELYYDSYSFSRDPQEHFYNCISSDYRCIDCIDSGSNRELIQRVYSNMTNFVNKK